MMPRETAVGETKLPYYEARAIATARPRPPRRLRRGAGSLPDPRGYARDSSAPHTQQSSASRAETGGRRERDHE
ncbi:unnamed protein product [Trichogramma brassicae]|uniref:Uncharacterized protein n=1 Tax=Trichogramma brassicae TaxID=86971 RepID=A0A6H5IRY1_9HYME|nr:unnamed protein product [Trichogramma brassicae]